MQMCFHRAWNSSVLKLSWASLQAQMVKNLPATQEYPDWILGSGRSPGQENDNRLQEVCWRIPWTEESGRLQSVGSQGVRHD